MIARNSGLEMGVGKMWRPLREVGVLALPDAGLDTMPHIESVDKNAVGAGVLQLHWPGMAVGVYIDRR